MGILARCIGHDLEYVEVLVRLVARTLAGSADDHPRFSVEETNLRCAACGAELYSMAAREMLERNERCACGGRLEAKPLGSAPTRSHPDRAESRSAA